MFFYFYKGKSQKLPNWEDRSEITSYLTNPAFCSEILRKCVVGYKTESAQPLPFALSVLVLPFILNNSIRGRLPKNKSNTIHGWIHENEDLKIGLANNINGYMPFTREAIMFGIAHNSLSIDTDGNVEIRKRRGQLKSDDEEIKDCLKKAELIGKLLAKSGTPITIYSILGIKP